MPTCSPGAGCCLLDVHLGTCFITVLSNNACCPKFASLILQWSQINSFHLIYQLLESKNTVHFLKSNGSEARVLPDGVFFGLAL